MSEVQKINTSGKSGNFKTKVDFLSEKALFKAEISFMGCNTDKFHQVYL